MNLTCILDKTEPGIARVWVYDKGHQDVLGRYIVSKVMNCPNGKVRFTATDYKREKSARNYAIKWLANRVATFRGKDGAK
jgi:hypothetical protein